MNVLDSPFMRRSKSPEDLTEFSEQSISRGVSEESIPEVRGRPTRLSDGQLYTRRDQLVQIFEGTWPEIYRELLRCKKADALISIFTPVADPKSWIEDALMVFCRSSSEPASGTTLSKLRAELRALAEPRYSVEESKRQAEDKLRQVNSALDKAHGSSRRIVKRERKKRRKAAWKAAQQLLALSDKEKDLQKRLPKIESSFARHEVFRFIKSKRYTLT